MKKYKFCNSCKKDISISDFSKNSCHRDGTGSYCKKCTAKRSSIYYENNVEKVKKYRQENSEKIKEKAKIKRLKNYEEHLRREKNYRDKNKKKRNLYNKQYKKAHAIEISQRKKEYRKEHAVEVSEQKKKYNSKNKAKISKWRKKYFKKNKIVMNAKRRERHRLNKNKYKAIWNRRQKERWAKNDEFRILVGLRNRINKVVKSQKTRKCNHTKEFIGCTVSDLKKYLESLFLPGMTWKNHNRYGWHIDHIRPCASFNLINPDEQIKCFHYTNLQPMWGTDNLTKNSSYQGKKWQHKKD